MTSLLKQYQTTIAPALQTDLGLKNINAVPKIKKVVLNIGLSKSLTDKSFTEVAVNTLQRISGQKPILTKAKTSISNFKIREGMVVGATVTLRGAKMYDFIEKLVNITFPRIRDFHGLEPHKGFDGHGNFSVGFREHIVFPEIKSDEIEKIHGLEVALNTTAKTDAQALALLRAFGFPFMLQSSPTAKKTKKVAKKKKK
jgi:large subunit ribosomal protein L5